jgi:hypothetical protein
MTRPRTIVPGGNMPCAPENGSVRREFHGYTGLRGLFRAGHVGQARDRYPCYAMLFNGFFFYRVH